MNNIVDASARRFNVSEPSREEPSQYCQKSMKVSKRGWFMFYVLLSTKFSTIAVRQAMPISTRISTYPSRNVLFWTM